MTLQRRFYLVAYFIGCIPLWILFCIFYRFVYRWIPFTHMWRGGRPSFLDFFYSDIHVIFILFGWVSLMIGIGMLDFLFRKIL